MKLEEVEEILPDTTDEMLKTMTANTLCRMPDEKFEDYKKRRHVNNIITKFKLKGTLFWDSYKKGQYIRGM